MDGCVCVYMCGWMCVGMGVVGVDVIVGVSLCGHRFWWVDGCLCVYLCGWASVGWWVCVW